MEKNEVQKEMIRQAEEPVLVAKMREQFGWFAGLSCLFGVIYTFCLYDNPAGITFPLFAAAVIVFSVLFLRKNNIKIKRYTHLYFLGILLLGISMCLTANGFIHFFNRVGIILLFCAAMLHQMYEDKRWNFPAYVKRIFILLGTCIPSLAKPVLHISYQIKKEKSSGRKQMLEILAGTGIAILFLVIILPLLIQSDRVFAGYFSRIFQNINIGMIVQIIFMFLAGSILFYTFFAALFQQNIREPVEKSLRKTSALTGITFTAILAVIYVIYSGIQIVYLFLRLGKGLPAGVTYSQYARSGFWQLLAVSMINIITVLICMQVFEKHRILKIFLFLISICTCIMTVSAAYRMMLYVEVYHLTFLRILVLWFLGVLLLIMLGIMASIFRKEFHLFQYITIVVACCYIGFSFAKVDGIIASYNISHSEEMYCDDVYYLMYQLSEDATPYIAEIDVTELKSYNRVYTTEDGVEHKEDEYVEIEVRNYFRNIKNEETSVRQWNASKAQARKAAEKYLENH